MQTQIAICNNTEIIQKANQTFMTDISENFEGTFFHLNFDRSRFFYFPNTKITSQVWIQVYNVKLNFAYEFQTLPSLVSASTNELWKENFSQITKLHNIWEN